MNERTPKVFIIERMPFDYTPATSFGEVVFIDESPMAPDAPNEEGRVCRWNYNATMTIEKALAEYRPGFDYVVPTGSPLRMMLTGMVLAKRGAIHKILKWDQRSSRYLCYTLPTSGNGAANER